MSPKSNIQDSNNKLATPQDTKRRTLDPIVTLIHPNEAATSVATDETVIPSALTSVCFIRRSNNHGIVVENSIHQDSNGNDDGKEDCYDSDDNSDDSTSPVQLQCTSLLQQHQRRNTTTTTTTTTTNTQYDDLLSNRLLVSCDARGECCIWDIGRRQIIHKLSLTNTHRSAVSSGRNGPGLTIRRLQSNDQNYVLNNTIDDSRFFYQTRDVEGTISLHDANTFQTIQTIQCYSQSFCCASSSSSSSYNYHGTGTSSNLIATPCQEHSYVMVRDWRMSSLHHPVAYFHGGTGDIVIEDDSDDIDHEYISNNNNIRVKRYGMLSSLAMCTSMNGASTMIACGMENGSIVYHDLSKILRQDTKSNYSSTTPYSISVGTDPILSLDMVPSKSQTNNDDDHKDQPSYVTIAGMAGNEEDLLELPEIDRGRIAIIKTAKDKNGTQQVRLRSRLSTMDATSELTKETTTISYSLFQGKPGISQCRFRPSDGRLFAVGGWDKRVRIYDRCTTKNPSSNVPLAILRGHAESVNAIDWSDDSIHSGLIATGSSDGKIHIWRCFPSNACGELT